MAKKGGLGRGLSEIMAAEPQGSRWHPVISPVAFAAATERTGGATVDVNTGEQVNADNPELDTYIVGKEPDTAGVPIPTKSIRSSDVFTKVNAIRKEILEKTGARPGASIGSWKTSGGAVDIDASASEPDLSTALGKADARGEKAIWSTKKFREAKMAYSKQHGIPYEKVEAHAKKRGVYLDGDIPNPNYKGK